MKKFGLSLFIGLIAFALITLIKLQPIGKTSVSAATLTSTVVSTTTPSPVAASSAASTATPSTSTMSQSMSGMMFKNGTYTGSSVNNGYGTVQVAAVISNGKLTDVKILQVPSDRRSIQIASYSSPTLIQEAVSAQSSNVDYVSGATATSDAFSQSLSTALSQAKS